MAATVGSDIEIANVGADNFLRLFYTTQDSDSQTRRENVPKFYRSTSTVNWNGTALVGADAIAGFLARMPLTRHEVQSYDCHAIPGQSEDNQCGCSLTFYFDYSGSSSENRPPSLLVTVSGIVVHGPAAKTELPAVNAKTVGAAPRVFSQSFVLMPEDIAPGTTASDPKYYVAADSLRFVG